MHYFMTLLKDSVLKQSCLLDYPPTYKRILPSRNDCAFLQKDFSFSSLLIAS